MKFLLRRLHLSLPVYTTKLSERKTDTDKGKSQIFQSTRPQEAVFFGQLPCLLI